MSPQTQTHNTQTKTYKNKSTEQIHYQKEVEKWDLIRRLKLDIEELETKLEGSEFQRGITSTKKEHLKEVVLTKGMKSALLWWRRGEGEGWGVK